jgi:hypothetical protein
MAVFLANMSGSGTAPLEKARNLLLCISHGSIPAAADIASVRLQIVPGWPKYPRLFFSMRSLPSSEQDRPDII